jgi:malate synthase
MPQQDTPTALSGKQIAALFGDSIADGEKIVRVLDDVIPLQGASHADVSEYVIESPMRYAECLAVLSDGRKVGLQDPSAFVGWSGHDRSRSLLFRSSGKHFEVATDAALLGHSPGGIRELIPECESDQSSSLARQFIGIDGHPVMLPDLPANV